MAEMTVPQMQQLVADFSVSYGISTAVVSRLAAQESLWNPKIVNPKSKCTGIFQLNPRYFGKGGVDLTDAATNIRLGMAELYRLHKLHQGNWFMILIDWNYGGGNRKKLQKLWGDDWILHLPAETKMIEKVVLLK